MGDKKMILIKMEESTKNKSTDKLDKNQIKSDNWNIWKTSIKQRRQVSDPEDKHPTHQTNENTKTSIRYRRRASDT